MDDDRDLGVVGERAGDVEDDHTGLVGLQQQRLRGHPGREGRGLLRTDGRAGERGGQQQARGESPERAAVARVPPGRKRLVTGTDGSLGAVSIVFATHARYLDHLTGHGHPERPARLEAVLLGARYGGVDDALVPLEPAPATREEIERVHPAAYLDAITRFCAAGGGSIDADTTCSTGSWEAASLAAGAGLAAIEALDGGVGTAAFCAVRPPGHHATPTRAMGFCLLQQRRRRRRRARGRGERVLIVDYDAHHGNGTQDVFYADARVLYVSLHQWPLYPGTGRLDDDRHGRRPSARR